tara:strand:- start:850 stop:4263 length:3414 start_codon:yes stop_codon:yes gene_type:complete
MSYTNTRLVDCNRLNSSEYRQGSVLKNSWTSKVGSGINLEPGDKVSVHSSFISELGCGNNDVIETTGKTIAKRYFNYTIFGDTDKADGPYENYETENQNALPNKVRQRHAQNVDREVEITDNSLNIIISYYKNTNGEQHIHLPRRFDKKKATRGGADDGGSQEFWRANEYRTQDSYINGSVYRDPDWSARVNDDWMYFRNPLYGIDPNIEGEPANVQEPGTEMAVAPPPKDIKYTTPGPADASSTCGHGKGRWFIRATDNSRYTIFIQKKSFWSTVATDFDDEFPIQNDTTSYGLGQRDPALIDYIKYKEIKSYKIKDGFNSPANIGTQLTAELNNVKDIKTKDYYMGEITTVRDPLYPGDEAVYYGGPGQYQPEISLTIESDTYKLIDSANHFSFSEDNYNEYVMETGFSSDLESMRYYSSYSMIGVKRPEIFEALRIIAPPNFPDYSPYEPLDSWYWDGIQKINDDDTLGTFYNIISDVVADQNPIDKNVLIMTTIPWTVENLINIKVLFDAQQSYPELFDYRANTKVTSTNSRFLHFDSLPNTDLPLGYDGYEYNSDPAITYKGLPSQPLFVKCDEALKNIQNDGNDWRVLCFGFAYKYYNYTTSMDCIAFSTEGVSLTSQSDIFTHSGQFGSGVATERKIGFDWHFNAYGTDCILPYTGLTETDCDNRTFNALFNYDQPHYSSVTAAATAAIPEVRCVEPGQVASSVYAFKPTWVIVPGGSLPGNIMDFTWSIRHIYCGSIDPLIEFDTDTSRFQISKLHTPELSGNDFMVTAKGVKSGWSGDLLPGTDNGVLASTAVYKINKHIEPFLYTPDTAPYFTEMTLPNAHLGVQNSANVSNSLGVFSYPVTDKGHGFEDRGNTGYKKVNFRYINEPFLFNLANTKIKMWTIFDAESGIFIEDFGVNEEWVEDSLLGIMGFGFNQLDPLIKTGNTQTRLTKDTALSINPVTTNALITPLDTRELFKNIWGGSLPNNPSIPYSTMTNIYPKAVLRPGVAQPSVGRMNFNVHRCVLNQEIKATTTSAVFTALNLPRKMSIPYYLICSNLIGDNFYNGASDGQTAPIMAVVNRQNGFGDYYFGGESSNEFTITMSTAISSITTTILDPRMENARLDEDSCIIYKITRVMSNDLDIMASIK